MASGADRPEVRTISTTGGQFGGTDTRSTAPVDQPAAGPAGGQGEAPTIGASHDQRDQLLVELADVSPDQQAAWLESKIRETGGFSDILVYALVDRIGRQAVAERLADLFVAAAVSEPYATIARVYNMYLTGALPSRRDLVAVRAAGLWALRVYFAFMNTGHSEYDLTSFNDPQREIAYPPAAASLGELLNKFLADSRTPHPGWASVLQPVYSKPPEVRDFILSAERDSRFLDRIFDDGCLTMPDPATGEAVKCCDSFVLGARIFYIFRGSELWLLVAGTAFNAPLVAYFPQRKIYYRIHSIISAMNRTIDEMPHVLARMMQRFAGFSINKPLPSTTPEGPILVVGTIGNPAHHLWNFLSGIERLRISNKLEGISRIVYGGSEFFGALDEIFPQMQGRVEHPARPTALDPSPFDPSRLLVGVGGYYIPRSLTERLIGLMKSRPRSKHADPSDYGVPPSGRIVWFGLRVGDKVWLGQETGIPAIIEAIQQKFPGSVCVLDGYSYPLGRDTVSEKWAAKIDETFSMAERIRKQCSRPDLVVNAVGNTFREAVLWAAACDAYLAPFGSAQHKVGWFSTRPGVVYVGSGFNPSFPPLSPGAIASEMSSLPLFVYGAASVQKGVRQKARASMNIDTGALLEPLLRLLEHPARA